MAASLFRVSLVCISLLAACLAVAPGAIPAAADSESPAGFETRILPILQAKCLACHGPQNQEKELDLGSRQSLLRGGASGPSVVPGSAERSLLFQKVETGEMPLGQDPLSPGELDSIRRWIDQGALADGQDPAAFQARHDLKPAVTNHDVLAPILHVRCLICHGRRKQEAGLDLRTRASILKGGKSGPAMVPGKPQESLLLQRIQAEEMPPPKSFSQYCVRPVTSGELEKLRRWIADGAPEAPRKAASRAAEGSTDREKATALWSLQPPRSPAVPRVAQSALVRTPIDAFLLEKLEARGLTFAPPADRLTLIRRAYLDLVGLPPTPAEVRAYHQDPDPQAYERLVDRLLDSVHYGERWGRYWLDAAGYADSEGKVHADNLRPHAYRYRDYVIRSFNNDKPYDRFLLEQIAGDELVDHRTIQSLTPDQVEPLIATGFLRMAPDGTWSGAQNFVPERLDVVADQVEVLSSTVMGLTLACARCHDHKYDPLPQRDFYRFSAILRSAYDPYDWLIPQEPLLAAAGGPFPKRLLRYGSEKEQRQVKRNQRAPGAGDQASEALPGRESIPLAGAALAGKAGKDPGGIAGGRESRRKGRRGQPQPAAKIPGGGLRRIPHCGTQRVGKALRGLPGGVGQGQESGHGGREEAAAPSFHPGVVRHAGGTDTGLPAAAGGAHPPRRCGRSRNPLGAPAPNQALPHREAGLEQRAPPGSGPVAGTTRSPLDSPGDGEPYLAAPFRQRPGGHARKLRKAGRRPFPSGIAGLAGHGVRQERLERESHAPADHDLQRLPAGLRQPRRRGGQRPFG